MGTKTKREQKLFRGKGPPGGGRPAVEKRYSEPTPTRALDIKYILCYRKEGRKVFLT